MKSFFALVLLVTLVALTRAELMGETTVSPTNVTGIANSTAGDVNPVSPANVASGDAVVPNPNENQNHTDNKVIGTTVRATVGSGSNKLQISFSLIPVAFLLSKFVF